MTVADARLRRFLDYLHASYLMPYAPKTHDERRWIESGGEPPAIVATYYRHRRPRCESGTGD